VSTKLTLDSVRSGRYTLAMKRLFTLLGALCVLALSVSGSVLVVRHQREVAAERQFIAAGPANLARQEAAARQEGIPLTAQQLQQPLPPASQNAAPLYAKLTKLLHDKPLGLPKYAEGMDTLHSYTPAQIAAVRHTLAARQDVMTLVHQAADKPHCVFVRDWSLGPDLMLPEYQPMRESARLIETESYLMARDGHYKEASANQERGFRIAEHAASDPTLLAYLVGIACQALALRGMQSVLALAGPNTSVDADVQQTISARYTRLSLHRALAVETGFGCACVLKMHQAENQGITAALTAGGLPKDPDDKKDAVDVKPKNIHSLIDAWQADYLAHMRVLVTASDLPPAERKAAFAAADRRLNQETQDTSDSTHLVTLILMPTITKLAENDTRTRARVAVTLAAVSVLAAKAKTGTFPTALPPSSVDPYTSKPLLYRREGAGGFVVYAVGPAGTFDGGKPGEKAPGQESVFRYPAVPMPIPADMLK
jgi:hypothetical protein